MGGVPGGVIRSVVPGALVETLGDAILGAMESQRGILKRDVIMLDL